jgi:hypothetical protein
MKTSCNLLAMLTMCIFGVVGTAAGAPHGSPSGNTGRANHATPRGHSVSRTTGHSGRTTVSLNNYSGRYANYHRTHGTRFSHGYCYYGRTHYHWSRQCWDTRYGCTCYFDPCCNCWYYWCEPVGCYYPVSYCPYRTYCFTSMAVQPMAMQQNAPVVPIPVASATYVQPHTSYSTVPQNVPTRTNTGNPSTSDTAANGTPPPPVSGLQTGYSPLNAQPAEPDAND